MKTDTVPATDSVVSGGLLLRLALGFFFLLEAFVKFRHGFLDFASTMTDNYADTFLPQPLLKFFFLFIPFLEVFLGVWILSGWKRNWSLFLTGIFVIVLLFGHLLKGMPYDSLFVLIIAIALALRLSVPSYHPEKEKRLTAGKV